ncbi:MAG: hypothetical protein BRC25_03510 [Parcubacteria group bacterium SW_6_46_9]|nr:MAG: hypothetical protein BRC25_03510 [Parcubacteria group bacterium SW_6_46_9]
MTDLPNTDNNLQSPLRKARQWVAVMFAITVWAYPLYKIFARDNAAAQLFTSDLLSAVIFTVFWWGLVGLGYALQQAEFTRDENGNITSDSKIKW